MARRPFNPDKRSSTVVLILSVVCYSCSQCRLFKHFFQSTLVTVSLVGIVEQHFFETNFIVISNNVALEMHFVDSSGLE